MSDLTQFGGNNFLPLEINYIPEFINQLDKNTSNEAQENKQQNLQQLRSLLNGLQATKGIDFEDDFLLTFLRHSKYNITHAYKFIRNFLNLRRNHIYFFEGMRFDFTKSPSCRFITVLPYRNTDGSVFVLYELGKWDPEELPFEDFKRIVFIMYQQELRNPVTQTAGFNVINDFKDTGFRHLKYCTPQNLYLLNHISFDCIPATYKGFHYVNGNFLLSTVVKMYKPFLTESIRKILFIHSSPEGLLEHFSPYLLPVQYGGKLEDYYMADWIRKSNQAHAIFPACGQKNMF